MAIKGHEQLLLYKCSQKPPPNKDSGVASWVTHKKKNKKGGLIDINHSELLRYAQLLTSMDPVFFLVSS